MTNTANAIEKVTMVEIVPEIREKIKEFRDAYEILYGKKPSMKLVTNAAVKFCLINADFKAFLKKETLFI